nr:hypothetical protein [Archangium sp. Cb G35]
MFRRPLALLSALMLFPACNPVTEEPPAAAPEPVAAAEQKLAVPGFAELHHHMFAEEAFGGGWFHGSHTGTLVSCDGGAPESDHARVRMDLSNMLDLCPNSGSVLARTSTASSSRRGRASATTGRARRASRPRRTRRPTSSA